MGCRGILFDFDGVVVKSMEQHFDAWQKSFAEKGVHITAEEFFVMEGQSIDTISQKIGADHGLTSEQVQMVKERKVNFYNQFMTIEFYDHFLDLLTYLQKEKIDIGVVTGGTRERVTGIVQKYFPHVFSCIVTADDVQLGKPFPDPFLAGAAGLKLKPEQCVVIENAPLGIKAGKAAGMTVIAITTTLQAHFLGQADYVYNDFSEVEKQLKIILS